MPVSTAGHSSLQDASRIPPQNSGNCCLYFANNDIPVSLKLCPTILRPRPILCGFLRNIKELVRRPAELFLGEFRVFGAQRFSVRLRCAGLGAGIANNRAHRDDGRLVSQHLRHLNRLGNRFQIISIGHALHAPVVGVLNLLETSSANSTNPWAHPAKQDCRHTLRPASPAQACRRNNMPRARTPSIRSPSPHIT